MKAKEVIQEFRTAVSEVKKAEKDMISVTALDGFLDQIEKEIDGKGEIDKLKFQSDLAAFKAEHERNLAHYEAQNQYNIEMLRSVLAFAQASLKASILINGGAAVALLAFIGKIWGQNLPEQAVDYLTKSIAFFSFGVLTAALGSVFSYLTQYSYMQKWTKAGIAGHVFAVVVVTISLGLFCYGSLSAYNAFVYYLKP